MGPLYVVVLAASLAAQAAAPAGPEDARVAQVPSLLAPVLPQAMPVAPERVERTTGRYGVVTIDHRRHLEVRASCRRCHGPGPVGKVTYTAQSAHERCIGCHKERDEGPSHCAGCHVRSVSGEGAARLVGGPGATQPAATSNREAAAPAPADPDPLAAETPAGPADTAAPEAPSPAAPAPVAAATLAPLPGEPSRPPPAPPAGTRRLEAGVAAGPGVGFSLRASSRTGALTTAYSFDRIGRAGAARMFGLLGAGLSLAPAERVTVTALAVAGFDAEERPRLGLTPAAGARLGVEWALPRPLVVQALHLSLTAVADLTSLGVVGHHRGGGRAFLTLGLGLAAPGR